MHCANDPALFDFDSNSTRAFIQNLVLFQKAYAPIHGRICVFLCLFGVVTNLIHCVVLTRPQMRISAVNVIMTAVAFCDLGTMGSYLVYIIHFVLQNTPNSCSNPQSYWWMLFLILHIFLSILLHTATLWLAVVMAFLRRMTLQRNVLYSHWQRAPLARYVSAGVLGTVFLLSVPSLLVHEIIEFPHNRWVPPGHCSAHYSANHSESLFTVIIRQSALANGCVLFKTNLWLTGLFFKVIPCLLLLTLSCSLMQKLRMAERKQHDFLANGGWGRGKRGGKAGDSRGRAETARDNGGGRDEGRDRGGTARDNGGGRDEGRDRGGTARGNAGGRDEGRDRGGTARDNAGGRDEGRDRGGTARGNAGEREEGGGGPGGEKRSEREAEREREEKRGKNGTAGRWSPATAGGGTPNLKKINSDRTTAILLAVLTVFIFTELPQGLIAILNAIYTADVHRFIYLTLGDLLDLLSLVNSSCNFVLYCLMSSQYRQTFYSLLSPIAGFRCATTAHQPIATVPNFASQADRDNRRTWQMNEMRRRRSTPIYRWMALRDAHPPVTARAKLSACSQLLRPPSAIREF